MSLLVAAMLVGGIALPHVLRLHRAPPASAAALWSASLALRAVSVILTVLYLLLFLPGTELYLALTRWCWHTVLPLLAAHLGLEGHRIGDAATLLPGVLLGVSLLSAAIGVYRGARALRRLLRRHALGEGPRESLIVGGPDVLLAAAGLRRPRVLVSAGALTQLDDEELAAGLDHEHGHIARRHRFVLLFAQLCHSVGRLIPGSHRALDELTFQLERDADRWALQRSNDPFALASVICKAATSHGVPAAAMPLAGSGVVERLDQLVTPPPPQNGVQASVLASLAIVMVTLVLTVVALVPGAAVAGVGQLRQDPPVLHCPS